MGKGKKPKSISRGWGPVMYNMYRSPTKAGTDMDPAEALEIVLDLARMHEFKQMDDFDFEWEVEHSEACGIVDSILDSQERGDE